MKNSEKSQTSSYICAKYTSSSAPSETSTTTSSSVPGIAENLDGVDQYYINRVNSYLAYVPENVKVHFTNNGWHIYVTQMNLASTYFPQYNSVQGCTMYGEARIYIEDRDSAVSSVVHEMGHYIDHVTGYPSLSAEFADIYNAEVATFKAGIPNSSSVRDQMEFFAETFHYLCLDSSKCTPRAAEFVSRYVNAL